MRCSDILLKYKQQVESLGRTIPIKRYRNLLYLVNASEALGEEELSQATLDSWAEKNPRESSNTYRNRIRDIRLMLRYANTQQLCHLTLPAIFVNYQDNSKLERWSTPKTMMDSTINKHIDKYLEYLRIIRPNTSPHIQAMLRIFNDFVARRNGKDAPLTTELVMEWCAQRPTERCTTRNARVLPVRSFLKFGNERKWFKVEVPSPLKDNKVHRQPHFFTTEEVEVFFKEMENGLCSHYENLAGLIRRIQAPVFFRLLYSSGMRTSEARRLRKADVNLSTGVIDIVKTKTITPHRIVVHDSLLEILRRYDEAMERLMPRRNIFFPSEFDREHSKKWYENIFNRFWKELFPNIDARSYDFRSTYAIININSWGYDGPEWLDKLVYLSRSMGHKNISSTCYYYHLTSLFNESLELKAGEQLDALLPDFNNYYDDETEY